MRFHAARCLLLSLLMLPFGGYAADIKFDTSFKDTVEGMSKVRRVFIPLSGKEKSFDEFKYMTFPKKNFDPNKFTLVYIPGGPGGAVSYAPGEIFSLKQLPADIQFLFLDLRGTGINLELGEEDPKNLSTAKSVDDIIEVLKHARLSNYVIWGNSYGTIVATQLTHRLEAIQFNQMPKATVLEGTFGKAYAYSKHFYEGFEARLRDFYSQMPTRSRTLVAQLRKEIATDNSYEHAMKYSFLEAAYSESSKRYTVFDRAIEKYLLGRDGSAAIVGAEEPRFKTYSEMPSVLKGFYINQHIVCNEMVELNTREQQQEYMARADFKPLETPCAPEVGSKTLYDSVNFQISQTPVIYLQGFNDFQTPLPSALHHYFGQKNLVKGSGFSLIFGANHGIFDNKFASCLVPFAKDLKSDDLRLSEMRACAASRKMEIKDYER